MSKKIFLARGKTRMSRGIYGLPDRRYRHGRDVGRCAANRSSDSWLVRAWENMVQLCASHRRKYSYLYRGRNIRVCKAWESFERFRTWATAIGYKPGLYLARRNKFRGYKPSNCFWDSFKRRVPIRCVETGEEFPTMLAAARRYGAASCSCKEVSRLSRALRKGCRAFGLHWKRLPLTSDLRRAQTETEAVQPAKAA